MPAERNGHHTRAVQRFVQGNLAICRKNSRDLPPLLSAQYQPCRSSHLRSAIPEFPRLGIDLESAPTCQRYRIWRDGEVVEEPTDITAHWRDDLVAFVLGAVLLEGRCWRKVCRSATSSAMSCACRCSAPISPAAPQTRLTVHWWLTMRPFKPADAIRAVADHFAFPFGGTGAGSYRDPDHRHRRPRQADYGDPVPVEADEIPVFGRAA